jgi:DNA repair exonuclease SbcCD nuclease subunit
MRRLLCIVFLASLGLAADPRFVILGDRTGGARPGVFEQILKEADAEHPDFLVTVGDIIEGGSSDTAEAQWQLVDAMLKPYTKYPIYLTPGNHDIFSPLTERLFREHSGHAPHYSFDRGPIHFTVLDNSRSEAALPAAEIAFLEQDFREHAAAPVKFVLMHCPNWLFPVTLRQSDYPLHRLALKYGVKYVIAGHVHQLMHAEFEGVTYLAMPSAGGHLRGTGKYEDGWFFGHALVEFTGNDVHFEIREAKAPNGEGRVSKPSDWTLFGRSARF